jgi:hypothetical protein
MQNKNHPGGRTRLLIGLAGLLSIAALISATGSFRSQAVSRTAAGLIQRTESHDPALENYDIRTDSNASDRLAVIRGRASRAAADIVDIRGKFAAGEAALRSKVASLKVEYNPTSKVPEVIAPGSPLGRTFLTGPSARSRAESLRSFAQDNSDLLGVSKVMADKLVTSADYSNPEDGLAFARLEQRINNIPVFNGGIQAGFTKDGELVRVVNNLAAGVDETSASQNFGDPAAAVKNAAQYINHSLKPTDLTRRNGQAKGSTDNRAEFGDNEWGPTAEKIYFPTEPGVVVPAWRVLIWQPTNAYYVIVDAEDGSMLWRKNISEDQSQGAIYNVWINQNAMIPLAESPFPFKPGPTNTNGAQGTALARTPVARVGNEAPYTFNNLGWIPDNGNETDGNNVEAGLDRDVLDGVDTANGRAFSVTRNFDFPISPGNPNTDTGDSPTPVGEPVAPCGSITQPHAIVDAQVAAITQLFYISNLFHDETYRLGFNEAAGNFQNDNFGRGGMQSDRVSAEAQDCSGSDNANFATAVDGQRGRMQMYLWLGPTPDFDGDLDATIVLHELTHGLSNRLHSNANGLTTNMARGMGEGYSDFYAHCLLSEPSDPINGIYTIGGYALYRKFSGFTSNYFYGIRRFPKAVKSFTGGPGNHSFNPLTFADADSTQFNVSDGAFPASTVPSGSVDQVHNLGEIWSSALWEVRAKFITRLGWSVGNRRILQIVTDGMKLAPSNPTFLQERDAIIAAAQAGGSPADVADIWSGFAIRGMGSSAVVVNPGSGNSDTRVMESFDSPNLTQTAGLTVSDPAGNNNGYAEPGEQISVTIPLTNITGVDANNVSAQITGGGSANYGTIGSGATVSRSIGYTVPAATPCGTSINLSISVNSSIGSVNFTRTIIVGVPSNVAAENFDNVAAPAVPSGWTVTQVQGGVNFLSTTELPDTAPNAMFALDPPTNGGGTDLTSPPLVVSAQAATVTFQNRYDTEANWDGGVLEISIGGGDFQDIIAAGGRFITGGYNGVLGTSTNNPLNGRAAWTGSSGGVYITTSVQLPPAAAGQTVRLKWRFGADNNGAVTGWFVDTVRFVLGYQCGGSNPRHAAAFDFDGDGKTDISIYRPGANAEWWISKSSNGGVLAAQFGAAGDQPVAADYTGDGKTDMAFFRPSTGTWFILRSEDFSFYGFPFGSSTDVPAPADFDGDGRADPAVFRSGSWFVLRSTDGGVTSASFGLAGDKPVPADYDGDGKADMGIYRPNGGTGGEWWIQRSTAGLLAASFGSSADKTVVGDYTGDGKADCAFFRPSDGTWYVLRSEDLRFFGFPFGNSTDQPAPGDYDGDGKTDAAVFRQPGSQWFVNRSSGGVTNLSFGAAGDQPVPGAFVR